MPRPPVASLDAVIERSIQEQAEGSYRPPATSALTQQVESSRQRQANIPGHHYKPTPYIAVSAESDEDSDSDSDDSGLQIKYPSKRPGDTSRQMITPTPRQRPNDDESKPQPTRRNALHAERPERQRNEEILSQQRPARIPSSEFLFEGQIPDEPAAPQKPHAVRAKPPPQEEGSQQQPHGDPRGHRSAGIAIPDILNRGTIDFRKLQAAQRARKSAHIPLPQEAQRAPKPAPKPQPQEAQRAPKPAPRPQTEEIQRASKPASKPQPQEQKPDPSASQHQKSAQRPIPQPLSWGFPAPPRPTQAMQLQPATAQGRQPDDSPSQRRRPARGRQTPTTISDNRPGPRESDDEIFEFEHDDGSRVLSALKAPGR